MTKRKRRTFPKEFKEQIVKLHDPENLGRNLSNKDELTPSSLDNCVPQNKDCGSFEEKDNRTPEQEKLIRLHKEIQTPTRENVILKQAAQIMGQK